MPIYEAICSKCGKAQTYKSPIDERNETPLCCDRPTDRVILSPPMGFVDSPAAGKVD